jgi:hypothetical protein
MIIVFNFILKFGNWLTMVMDSVGTMCISCHHNGENSILTN